MWSKWFEEKSRKYRTLGHEAIKRLHDLWLPTSILQIELIVLSQFIYKCNSEQSADDVPPLKAEAAKSHDICRLGNLQKGEALYV